MAAAYRSLQRPGLSGPMSASRSSTWIGVNAAYVNGQRNQGEHREFKDDLAKLAGDPYAARLR
jgi:hypothetical protein